MRFFFIAFAILTLPAAATAQEPAAQQTLEYSGQTWRVAARLAETVQEDGREILVMGGGYLWLNSASFSDGVIEFDARFDEVMGFIGPAFRAESDDRFEEFYFRSHLNNKPDALQYTPVENGNSAWQIFSDANAIAPVSQHYDDWNHIKVVVKGDKADFYFNSDAPVLHVPDLKTDIKSGYVGLRVTGAGAVRFSNVTIRPLLGADTIVGAPKEAPSPPTGLINAWSFSTVFPEANVAEELTLPRNATDGVEWDSLSVETNGIANISKIRTRLADGDSTVFARMTIRSDRGQMKELRFGYSDRVRIYLNGKRIYYGDAGWTVRDYRFLGTVGFFDSAALDLKKGDNELLVAISETFGGWAWAGAIEDQSGLQMVSE